MYDPLSTMRATQQGQTGLAGQVRQMMQMIRAATNPQAAMQMLLQRSPYYAQAQQLIAQAGGDAGKAFRALAAQNGLDPEKAWQEITQGAG